MDLTKAFVSVFHPILISSLQIFGMVDCSLNGFEYLKNRRQNFEISQCATKYDHLESFSVSFLEKVQGWIRN